MSFDDKMNVLYYLLQQIYLGYQVVLKSWAIKKCHVSYTRKFVYNTIKNQIVDFYELKKRNVNVLEGNSSLFSPETNWLSIQKFMCVFIHIEPLKTVMTVTRYCPVSCLSEKYIFLSEKNNVLCSLFV